MATLHLISSPAALTDCLRVAGPQDTLVLMEDGVYATGNPDIQANIGALKCYRLADDASMRGLSSAANDIDYNRLVALCTEHQPIVTWC